MPYTIVRPSALYGERCVSRRVGQIFIENALMKKPITINGDPEERLDFTYIDDLIQGVKLIIEKESSKNLKHDLRFSFKIDPTNWRFQNSNVLHLQQKLHF